jgi:N-methylhydantoinase B
VKQYIERFPEGSFQSKVSFEDEEQKAVSIHVKATREQGKWVFDFSGTSSQVRSPLNSPFTSTCAFATWPLFVSMSNEIAINDGTLAPFQFHVPQGSVLSPAFPAATAFSGKITGHFISKAVVKALRNGGVPEEMCPSVHGLGSQAILFPPFGQQRETQPIFLAPGFPPSASDWGPPDLFGERLLVSAEELEFYQGFQISSREYDDEQRTGMTVGFTNKKADLYVNLLLPAQKGTDYGSVEFHGKHDEVFNKSTAEELLNLGDRMIFHYSEKAREDS